MAKKIKTDNKKTVVDDLSFFIAVIGTRYRQYIYDFWEFGRDLQLVFTQF